MVTLAIAVILITVAIPSFSETIKNNRLATAQNTLAATLALARSEALKTGRRVSVCVSNDQATCTGGTDWSVGWLAYQDRDNSATFNAGDPLVKVQPGLPPGMTLTGTGSVLSYTPQGAAAVAGTLTLCDDRTGETGRQLTINNTGRPTLTTVVCS